ncbi:ABC transporter permease, partial [uncultured Mesotoga sp.]
MFRDVFSLFIENRKALIGLIILAFFSIVAIFAPLIAPYDPKTNKVEVLSIVEEEIGRTKTVEREEIDEFTEKRVYTQSITTTYEKVTTKLPLNAKPSRNHLLGTTRAGQDLFSQMVYGTRITLAVGLITGLFTTLLALTLALVAGYFGGIVDDIISLFTNVFLVIPSLPLMIVIAAYITVKGVIPIVLILGLTSWPWPTRILRSQVVSLKNRDFVRVSRILGERPLYIVFREILPNMISLVM